MGTGCFGKLGRVLQTAIKFVVTKEGTTYNHLKPSDTSSKTSTTTHKQSNTILGPDYMANFIPGWNFSSANWAQISDRPLKQILWKPNCRLHGEGFSPAKRAWKSEKVSCNRNGISARAEKGTRACALSVCRTSVNFLTEICVLRPGRNWACNHNDISARWAERNFSPGWNPSSWNLTLHGPLA